MELSLYHTLHDIASIICQKQTLVIHDPNVWSHREVPFLYGSRTQAHPVDSEKQYWNNLESSYIDKGYMVVITDFSQNIACSSWKESQQQYMQKNSLQLLCAVAAFKLLETTDTGPVLVTDKIWGMTVGNASGHDQGRPACLKL